MTRNYLPGMCSCSAGCPWHPCTHCRCDPGLCQWPMCVANKFVAVCGAHALGQQREEGGHNGCGGCRRCVCGENRCSRKLMGLMDVTKQSSMHLSSEAFHLNDPPILRHSPDNTQYTHTTSSMALSAWCHQGMAVRCRLSRTQVAPALRSGFCHLACSQCCCFLLLLLLGVRLARLGLMQALWAEQQEGAARAGPVRRRSGAFWGLL